MTRNTNLSFVLDTSALLKSSNYILEIIQNIQALAIIPNVVIKELDRIKDNKTHKENRNAHKVLQAINHCKRKEIHKGKLEGDSPDEQIRHCAKLHNAWLVSEDKTFGIYDSEKTLKVKEFIERFQSHKDDIPNAATNELFDVIRSKDINKLDSILQEKEIKINAYDDEGFSVLIRAIKTKNIALISKIVQYDDIDLHKCDKSHLKMTPLAHATQCDMPKIVSLLLEHNAKPYICSKGANKGNTPFLMACWDNRRNAPRIMETLLNNGISINQVDNNGFSGLIKACIKGHSNIVRWLLEKGADSKIRDFENKDALTHSKENKHDKIVAMLECHNAK
ncbi:ankryin [Helicobacter muridarum]|uniref:Ankryin n=1 Tax=Helicobacter muridarum TaxID=216 RepID=A0A377PV08_9HELI|nr:ankyrin repeat domain-containing protein [Helicobacter muridarum]TLD98509.1 ankryin [Helicobacter muridarum]STQ86808.1 ankyrin repeat-containing protein [Helicobacter muridarum]